MCVPFVGFVGNRLLFTSWTCKPRWWQFDRPKRDNWNRSRTACAVKDATPWSPIMTGRLYPIGIDIRYWTKFAYLKVDHDQFALSIRIRTDILIEKKRSLFIPSYRKLISDYAFRKCYLFMKDIGFRKFLLNIQTYIKNVILV